MRWASATGDRDDAYALIVKSPALAALLFSLLIGAFPGCARTYTVELLNKTEQTVRAELVTNEIGPNTVEGTSIRPGEYGTLGPADAAFVDTIRLEVRPQTDPYGQAARLVLSPGLTEAEIYTDGSWGKLHINPTRVGGRTPEEARNPPID
ncbi:MAG: hypothetical protein AAGB51_13000 [Planctomycetota bacterium]